MRYLFALLLIGSSAARAQTYAIAPVLDSPVLNPSTGQPLSGGLVYVCGAGLTCPGNPATTYTDSTGSTPLSNPLVLNAAGYPQCSAPGASCPPFLNTALFYKFVIQNSSSVTLYVFDGISAAGGGGGSTTNYWTLTGTTIKNNNAAGAGDVQTGSDILVGGNAVITGNIQLTSPAFGGFTATIQASNLMPANVAWYWPVSDSAGCLQSNGSGQLSFSPCGGGGSGSPGGALYSVQFQNPASTFAGDPNFLYEPAVGMTPAQLSLTGGFVEATMGFDAANVY